MKFKSFLWLPAIVTIFILTFEIVIRIMDFNAFTYTYTELWKPHLCKRLLEESGIPHSTYELDFKSNFKTQPLRSLTMDPGLRSVDNELGIRLNPNYTGRSVQTDINGHINFDVQYNTDAFGRRKTIDDDAESQTKNFLMFGSSDLFGYGVNDDETLPSYIANKTKTLKVVNYGVDMWGPGNILKLLKSKDFYKELIQRETIGIYYFHYHHLTRLIGSLNLYRFLPTWPSTLPYFKIENQKLIQDGILASRPTDLAYRLLSQIALLTWFKVDFPIELCESDLKLFTEVIYQMNASLKEKFSSAKLIVLFQPDTPKALTKVLIDLLDKKGIEYLNYSNLDLQLLTSKNIRLPDSHPSPLWNELLANQLIQDLNLK